MLGKKTTRAIYIMFSPKMQTCSVKSGYLPYILVNLKKNVEEASFPQQNLCSLSKLLTFYRIVQFKQPEQSPAPVAYFTHPQFSPFFLRFQTHKRPSNPSNKGNNEDANDEIPIHKLCQSIRYINETMSIFCLTGFVFHISANE